MSRCEAVRKREVRQRRRYNEVAEKRITPHGGPQKIQGQ